MAQPRWSRGSVPTVSIPVARPPKLDESVSPFFWHPSKRFSCGPVADRGFVERLEKVDPKLAVAWNNHSKRWQVWSKKPTLKSGWQLLFAVQDHDGSYAPLDERVFHRLFAASADRWGSAREYWAHVENEFYRDKAKRVQATTADSVDKAMEVFEHTQIKNINSGSNFSDYHQ